ncbi:MAG: DUF1778 domain-containing protein [Blastocatellia bacterium]
MPAHSITERSERFDMRIRADVKQRLLEAATLQQQSLTAFAEEALEKAAREVLERSAHLELSRRASEQFLAALEAAPEPGAALKRAARRYRQFRKGSERARNRPARA